MADPDPEMASPPPDPPPAGEHSAPPLWVAIVGACFLGLAVLFFMALVVVSLFGHSVPGNSRFLVCAVLALCSGIGSGFLGGSAVASGQINVPKLLDTPVRFGLTGGIAVLVIVLLLCHNLYREPSQPPVQRPTINDINTTGGEEGRIIVSVSYRLESLPAQHKIFVEIAGDSGFQHQLRERFRIDNFTAGEAVLSVPKSSKGEYHARLVVDDPEGKIVAVSESRAFGNPID